MITCLTLIVICAVLYRWGGEGLKPFYKNWRRWGIGIILAVYGLLTGRVLGVLCIASSQLFRLPITFEGDEIDSWQDWCWIPVLGMCYGLVPSFLALSVPQALWMALMFSIPFTVLVVLSNWKLTSDYFKWELCEAIFGSLIGYTATKLVGG